MNSQSAYYPTAEVRVIFSRRWQPKCRLARVIVSGRIYWKEVKDDSKSLSLSDFCDVDSLELNRLDGGTWPEVEEFVKADEHDGKPCIVVPGSLHGPTRRKHFLLGGNVKVVLIPRVREQRDVWLGQIRARVAPWELLQQRVRALASYSQASGGPELAKQIGELVVNDVASLVSQSSSVSTHDPETKRVDKLSALPGQMQKLAVVHELNGHATAAVETGSTLVKLLESAECVVETAEFVADVAKGVAGVSTVFQLVVLCARLVSMYAESNRGCRVLPVALRRIVVLLRYVLQSLAEIMSPSLCVETLHEDFVFDVLRQTVDTMDVIETQLLRGRASRFLNAKLVKEVEGTMKELELKVVTATNISKTSVVSQKVTQLENQSCRPTDEHHHIRPRISPFFVGRTKELGKLKEILEKRGSAVITQYGGAGKTELMIAFAERAERQKLVPGGVFWVTVDGGVADVVDSLANLVEKIIGKAISEEERKNPNAIVEALKRALFQRKGQGRWLLCLDNADNSDVSGLLNGICAIAGPSRANGWIVVTSRQGQPRTWNRMKADQKLVLQSLSEEDSMLVLWRQIQVIETDDADDDAVLAEINKLKEEKPVEYYALKELCDDNAEHGLGGLPLALVQAGTYIGRFECSFEEYLNLFRNASRKEDLESIMENLVELTPIREAQRSIWTTWRISVERLSDKAYSILRAMSMLGQTPIAESIVKGILREARDQGDSVDLMFRNVFMKELVHGSSLVYREEEHGERVYSMHRLVRRFILGDMQRGSVSWNNVFNLALLSLHNRVDVELKNKKRTFNGVLDFFGDRHREFVPHILAIIDHLALASSGAEVPYVSKVEDLHRYSGYLLRFFGKIQEEVRVWKRFCAVLRRQYGENKVTDSIIDVHCELGESLMVIGRLDEAVDVLERSLSMCRAVYGDDIAHRNIAKCMNNLGLVYLDQGKLEKAAEMHENSLTMKQTIHGMGTVHLEIATSISNLAWVYHDQGKLNEAVKMQERALEMKRIIYSREKAHPEIAATLCNLALVHLDLGNLERAAMILEESLVMNRTIYGDDLVHPEIAASLGNLGLVYREQGKLEEALSMHTRSLEMKRTLYGSDAAHSRIATSLTNLGLVYEDQGRIDDALLMHEESLRMRRTIHGHNTPHPETAVSLHNLALVYQDQGKLTKAVELLEESLKME